MLVSVAGLIFILGGVQCECRESLDAWCCHGEVGHTDPQAEVQLHVLVVLLEPQGRVSTWIVVLHQRALGHITGKREKIGSAETAGEWMNSEVSCIFSGCALQC